MTNSSIKGRSPRDRETIRPPLSAGYSGFSKARSNFRKFHFPRRGVPSPKRRVFHVQTRRPFFRRIPLRVSATFINPVSTRLLRRIPFSRRRVERMRAPFDPIYRGAKRGGEKNEGRGMLRGRGAKGEGKGGVSDSDGSVVGCQSPSAAVETRNLRSICSSAFIRARVSLSTPRFWPQLEKIAFGAARCRLDTPPG